MKKVVMFVQGAGEGAHEADAALVADLRARLGEHYDVRYPRMPGEDAPDESAWLTFLAAEIARLGDGAIVVGHSAGGSALMRVLVERGGGARLGGVLVLAAPFCGPGGWQIDGWALPLDLDSRLPAGLPVFLYHGDDDEIVPFDHLDLYAMALPRAVVRRLHGCGHQFGNDLSAVADDIGRIL